MTSEILKGLLEANLAGSAAILAVMALRLPARRFFGPELAYGLWALPPLAAAATLLPARTDVALSAAEAEAVTRPGEPLLLAAWLGGALVAAGLFAFAQWRFLRAMRSGTAGPAVVGVIVPRIVMPTDDGRYTPEERALIRAHEREHVARKDPRAGAVSALLQCLCWFNPLVHLAAHLLRLDQELACDAAVIRRQPKARALYARTLLKTQLATAPLPFGCYWPARGAHPLEVRVGLLKSGRRDEGVLGICLLATVALSMAILAWATQPPSAPRTPDLSVWDHAIQAPTTVLLITISPPAART